ncbi:hypothetical protein HJC23_009174 [Cyclotella cryptica]|uniref:Uncharacterized protein n=1 Tax=Cyclotella cryptica TaxID=29204 RepID=A0ABD3PK30_9STRA
MMMERAKSAPAPEEAKKPSPAASTAGTTSSKSAPISSHERMQDLERRLINLDPASLSNSPAMGATLSSAPVRPSAEEHSATPTPVGSASITAPKSPKSEPVKENAANTGKNNPLLVSVLVACCRYVTLV